MADVLVVGAGPTGLALSFELIRRGISVRLIDKKEGPSTHSKALAIQSRTLECFEKMGLLPHFLDAGLKVDGVNYHYKDQTLHLSLQELQAPYPFVLIVPQSKTEEILQRQLEEAGGHVERNTKLIDIIDSGAVIQTPDGERTKETFKFIIGCDGAHSTVRQTLKFPFKGVNFPEEFLLADVEAKFHTPINTPHIFFNKQGFGVIFPISEKGIVRLIFPLKKKLEEEKVNKQLLVSFLKARGFPHPFEINTVGWVSIFHIHRKMSTQFRKNNTFIAGDAAHIHSPVGGQGMNTSIQDAFNLAWKLELVLKGASPDSLLNTYEQERLPIAKQVLKGTTKATKLLIFCQKWSPALFYRTLKFILNNQKARQKILHGLTELSIHYPQNSIIQEPKENADWKGPKAGMRAPNCTLANGKQLFELLKTSRHCVLLFKEYPELEGGLFQEYGDWLEIHVIKGQEVQNSYAAEPDSIYIIRPDGYIGFRSRSLKTEKVISYLLKVFKPFSQRSKS